MEGISDIRDESNRQGIRVVIDLKKNIEADFWLIPDAYHVDAMLKYPNEYSEKMKQFFEENLK